MVAIVSRSEWGARVPRARHRISTPTPRLWVHHTAGAERGPAGVRQIQRFHMDTRGWNDIAYSFLVDPSGLIFEGRGVGVAGGHTAGDNTSSHAICLMGSFEHRSPTSQALASLVALARHGRSRGWWVPTLRGHREAPGAATLCPGARLMSELPAVRSRVATAATPKTPTERTWLDMASKQDVKDAVREVLDSGTGDRASNWPSQERSNRRLQLEIVERVRQLPTGMEVMAGLIWAAENQPVAVRELSTEALQQVRAAIDAVLSERQA